MNQLGAYFGSTRIIQGAAGLGQDGELQAYADGVVGGNAPDSSANSLFAYKDGSLGFGSLGDDSGPLFAYADGVVGGSASDPEMPGPLQSYHDGSLGDDAPGGLVDNDAEISVWHDGVLGNRSTGMDAFGPLQAFKDGSLGAYARAIGAASANVLDLGDTNILTELKSAMALLAPEQTLTADGQKTFTPDWYTDGVWDPSSSMLWQYIVSKSAGLQGKVVSGTSGAQTFPNATGIGYIVATLAAPQSGTYGPDYVKKNFPAMYAWFQAGGGSVLAPYLTITDKTQGVRATSGGAMKVSTMAAYGLGAVALLGIALVLTRKKR